MRSKMIDCRQCKHWNNKYEFCEFELNTYPRKDWEHLKGLFNPNPVTCDKFEPIVINTKLSKISAGLIGKIVKFEATIHGEIVGMAIERKIEVFCKNCEFCEEIDLMSNLKLLYSRLNKKENLKSKLRINCDCEKTKIEIAASNEQIDYSILFIRELPENIDVLSEDEYTSLASKTWKLFYIGLPPNAKKVRVTALVVKNHRDEIEFISTDIKPLEDEFLSLRITKKDHEIFSKYFNKDFLKAAGHQLAPHIVGMDFAKLSALLTLHSPYEIYDIYSRRIRGCLRTIWIGDTKTGKSEIGKDLTVYYKLGEIVFGEVSTRAGLTYTIDSENKVLIWGVLPLNDLKFVFIDGIHSLSSKEIEEMREVLEQQKIKVSRMVSGETMVRVRIIATLNPKNPPMGNYYYKIQALMDTNVFKDPVDLTRWDIVISFTTEDVPGDWVAEAKPMERPIPYEIFVKHVFWVWNLKPEQIRYSENAKEKIIQYSKELMKWVSPKYPLIHKGVRDQITRLSVAFACLLHSISENFDYVEVKEEHVEMARGYIDNMIELLDYDAFIYNIKKQTELKIDEALEIKESLDETKIEILRSLVSGNKSSIELATIVGISAKNLRENHYPKLKRFKLIETSHGFGARLTVKGIQFLKFLDNEKK
ncbi:MAG: hypothetical protein J7K36_04720 [Archaeoglobaceae archaeon]|nr:hypothetical protein [Archaeoglobaceae archaeon]